MIPGTGRLYVSLFLKDIKKKINILLAVAV